MKAVVTELPPPPPRVPTCHPAPAGRARAAPAGPPRADPAHEHSSVLRAWYSLRHRRVHGTRAGSRGSFHAGRRLVPPASTAGHVTHCPLQDESLELQLGGTRLTQVAWGSQRRDREPALPAPWPGFLAGPRSPNRNSFDDAATRKRATRCGVPFPREVNGPGEEPFKIRKRGFHKGKTFLL